MSASAVQRTSEVEDFQPIFAPTRRGRFRPLTVSASIFALFVIVLGMAVGILLYSPTVLEAYSAIFLKSQSNTIPWNGHDRITIVAMGLTQRTTEPARTDTLLVIDIDPVTHRIHMLSVPRDLWVNIPGYGQGKLAIAYAIGGPRLAAYTLEKALGIPVDYYMALTFRGFIKIIDTMGGVSVNVPQELNDPSYPCLTGTAYCPIDIKPGQQHMDGATALEFVRERHVFPQQDLARVQDQQAFSDAAKRTLLSPSTWRSYPQILDAFRQSLITNFPVNDVPELGVQYLVDSRNNLTHSYININNGMVQSSFSNDGQSILVPTSPTVIPNLVQSIFADPTLSQDNASVAVLNGTATSGVAADVEGTLQGLGFHTISAGNADSSHYRQSQIIENTSTAGPADYTARRLQRILNASLVDKSLPGQTARIVVVIGSSYAGG